MMRSSSHVSRCDWLNATRLIKQARHNGVTERAASSDNTPHFILGMPSQNIPRDTHCPDSFSVFFLPSNRIPGQYLETGHDCFHPRPLKLICSLYHCTPVYKTDITAVGIRRADHATLLYPQKLVLTSPTSGGHSVGIVRKRTKVTELLLCTTVLCMV
jgi:hypothetical protein